MKGDDESAIDVFDFHHSMLGDEIRTSSFRNAIRESVKPGDVVVDIGSGTGLLSLFAAIAGASRVYAIERGPIIELASEIASRNGLSESIVFVRGSSLDVEIPERADLLITETIGNAGLDEGIITWVEDARKRFLKPGALAIPASVDVMACLVCVPREFTDIDRWSQPLGEIDFSPMGRIAHNNLLWTDLSPAGIVTKPTVAFGTKFTDEPSPLSCSIRVEAIKNALVHGIGLWFRSTLAQGITITNAPPNAVPSWEQGFLPIGEAIPVAAGDQIHLEVSSSADGADWTWRVSHGTTHFTADGQLKRSETEKTAPLSHFERSNYAQKR